MKTEQVKPRKSRSRYSIGKAFIACYSQLLIFLGECINYKLLCVCVHARVRACIPCEHQVRTLKDQEVEQWLDFVAACFAFKGVDRSHFSTHYFADPWRNAQLVVVAEEDKEDMHSGATDPPDPSAYVATLRVFDRKIYLKDGSIMRVGGIGEVCTREDWQRKGLCRELLEYARGLMRANSMAATCLHTSSMGAVYRKVGHLAASFD